MVSLFLKLYYSGLWKNHQFSGEGEVFFPYHRSFCGTFVDGKPFGNGVYKITLLDDNLRKLPYPYEFHGVWDENGDGYGTLHHTWNENGVVRTSERKNISLKRVMKSQKHIFGVVKNEFVTSIFGYTIYEGTFSTNPHEVIYNNTGYWFR